MIDDLKHGGHARRMIAAYERMFAGRPEADILRSLGFFNRPAEPEALKLIMPEMKELEYRAALNRLLAARLVLTKNPAEPIDCHPLIREHFAAVMRSTAAEVFRQGHSRLYEHYCQRASEQPDTLDGMTPLFYAVYHGCKAGRYSEALNYVYRRRIDRGSKAYLSKTLGAFGADLSLLANFFETPWLQPVASLAPEDRTSLLTDAAFALGALGRLADALVPLRSAVEDLVASARWRVAAISFGNLSELLLNLGQMQGAIAAARQSVHFADLSGELFQRVSKRTSLADALLASGNTFEAQRLFVNAEWMQSEQQPAYPILYSIQGFRYCDLLIEQGQEEQVIHRATGALQMAESYNWLLDIGLDHLSLGRAYPSGSSESIGHLNQAVQFLRQSGSLSHLPLGLLARGTPHDLDEVFRIATRSGMRLYLTDYHLASARLALFNRDLVKAREHFDHAEKLINKTGYHRRDKSLEQLRVELG